jgi:hypothetical protein
MNLQRDVDELYDAESSDANQERSGGRFVLKMRSP